jgi:hypothetical protein
MTHPVFLNLYETDRSIATTIQEHGYFSYIREHCLEHRPAFMYREPTTEEMRAIDRAVLMSQLTEQSIEEMCEIKRHRLVGEPGEPPLVRWIQALSCMFIQVGILADGYREEVPKVVANHIQINQMMKICREMSRGWHRWMERQFTIEAIADRAVEQQWSGDPVIDTLLGLDAKEQAFHLRRMFFVGGHPASSSSVKSCGWIDRLSKLFSIRQSEAQKLFQG